MNIKTLKIATWNIWFDEYRMKKRMNEIMNIISNHNIDIFCLQELTQESFEYLTKHDYIQKDHKFYISSKDINDIGNYGNIIFSKFPISKVNILSFNQTKMYRKLVTVDMNINNEVFKICTTHLESLENNRAQRISQLTQSVKFIVNENNENVDHFIFCGDFNECGTMNDKLLPFPDAQFKDCWNDYYDEKEKESNPGWTMPKMCEFEAWRPDRIYYAFDYDFKQESYKEFIFKDDVEELDMKQNDDIPLLDLDGGLFETENETDQCLNIQSKKQHKLEKKGVWKLKNVERLGMDNLELTENESKYSDKLNILTPSDHYGVLAEFEYSSK